MKLRIRMRKKVEEYFGILMARVQVFSFRVPVLFASTLVVLELVLKYTNTHRPIIIYYSSTRRNKIHIKS